MPDARLKSPIDVSLGPSVAGRQKRRGHAARLAVVLLAVAAWVQGPAVRGEEAAPAPGSEPAESTSELTGDDTAHKAAAGPGPESNPAAAREQAPARDGQVRDSLAPPEEEGEDAREALAGLCWAPGEFTWTCRPRDPADDEADGVLRFPSARPCGDGVCDSVALSWFCARGVDGKLLRAPAMVVVHESGSQQKVGRLFARALRDRGVHAFMLHLPNYGPRKSATLPTSADTLLSRMTQGISDARRAYDVVRAQPEVDASRIGLQGISLGGFVASTTCGLDGAYSQVFILLAGGDLADIVQRGGQDAAKVRQRLEDQGLTAADIVRITRPVEPLRLAHRLDPERTWMYSATFDDVVPLENARRLAARIELPESHHVLLPADHYSGIVFYVLILDHMIERLQRSPAEAPAE